MENKMIKPKNWYKKEGVTCINIQTTSAKLGNSGKPTNITSNDVRESGRVICTPLTYRHTFTNEFISDIDIKKFITQYERYIVFCALKKISTPSTPEGADNLELTPDIFNFIYNDMEKTELAIPNGNKPYFIKRCEWELRDRCPLTNTVTLRSRLGFCLVPNESSLGDSL